MHACSSFVYAIFAAAVSVESSLGTERACPDMVVTYTCNVTEETFRGWTTDQSHDLPNGHQIVTHSLMSSTLMFTVTDSLNGTIIYCRGTNGNDSITLNIAGTLLWMALCDQGRLNPDKLCYVALANLSGYTVTVNSQI